LVCLNAPASREMLRGGIETGDFQNTTCNWLHIADDVRNLLPLLLVIICETARIPTAGAFCLERSSLLGRVFFECLLEAGGAETRR